MFGLKFKEILEALSPLLVVYPFRAPASIKGISLDTRTLRRGEGFLALKGKNYNAHNFLKEAQKKGASFLIVERLSHNLSEFSIPQIVVKDTYISLALIAQRLRKKFNPQVVAITGSLGKTTIKDMVHFLLKDRVKTLKNKSSENNRVGLPKTLLKLNPFYKVCVLELGTNHFGEIEYLARISQPDIGVISCIDNTHLKYFKDKKGVFREKISLVKSSSKVLPVLNGDEPLFRRMRFLRKPEYFGLGRDCDIFAEFIKREKTSILFRINKRFILRLKSLASFNIYNALAALAVARKFNIPLKESTQLLSYFKFPRMRFEIKKKEGVTFINDAYNSNPTALKRALNELSFLEAERKIGVIGDMLELGRKSEYFHFRLARDIYRAGFTYLILVGNYVKFIYSFLMKNGFEKKRVFLVQDVDEVSERLWRIVKRGDLVFLKGSRKFKLERILS